MMFGFRDTFEYFQCSKCECLQIKSLPVDIDKYYPPKYYSYSEKKSKTINNKIKDYLLPASMKFRLGISKSILGWLSNFRYKNTFEWLTNDLGKYRNKFVLDIGCGSGLLISYFQKCGFSKLTGIDPYLSESRKKNEISLLKKEVYDLVDKYDLIMMHHSFEHMSYPHKIFDKLSELITDDGLLLIRIPLTDSYAWRKYSTSWFQMDVPRHYYLHSVKSLNYLIEKYGFHIEKIVYDSTWQQFYFSESYIRNIALNEDFNEFTSKNKKTFQKQAETLNKMMDGDQACFYIRKKYNQNK